MARNTVLVFENFDKRTKRPKIQSLLNGKFGDFLNGIKFAVLKAALLRLHLAALAVVGVDAEEVLRRVEARLIARVRHDVQRVRIAEVEAPGLPIARAPGRAAVGRVRKEPARGAM